MNLHPKLWRFASTLLISTFMGAGPDTMGLAAASLPEVKLADVKSVYLFSMANGLDQYLADVLTRDHILRVVADPKAADAVLTDRLGDAFENELMRVRPELKPAPPPPPKKDDAEKDKDKDADKDKPEEKKDDMMPISSFHSARGTVFLVHAKTQQVVWSAYQRPGKHSPRDMEKTAARIAKMLEKDLGMPGTPVAVTAPVSLASPVTTAPAKK